MAGVMGLELRGAACSYGLMGDDYQLRRSRGGAQVVSRKWGALLFFSTPPCLLLVIYVVVCFAEMVGGREMKGQSGEELMFFFASLWMGIYKDH